MKFVHIADVHFDKPFSLLENSGLTERRRLEQREAFHKVIEYCKQNQVEMLLIAGDLYEHEYIRKSTIEYINQCFREIQDTTKVFIAPGNHDPYIANSYYHHFTWNDNVKIFDRLEKVEVNGVTLYGYGFTDFYSGPIVLPADLASNQVNLLLMHADINGSKEGDANYNPILETQLENSLFQYIALGHIHKNNITEHKKAVYPGSLVAGGFDELGRHGMIVGNIDVETKTVTTSFYPVDTKEFKVKTVDISEMNSEEELIESINAIVLEENAYYKIEFRGTKQFDIDCTRILKHITNPNILKMKDKTKIKYDIEALAKEKSLRGLFVQEILKNMKEDRSNEEELMRKIEMGLNIM